MRCNSYVYLILSFSCCLLTFSSGIFPHWCESAPSQRLSRAIISLTLLFRFRWETLEHLTHCFSPRWLGRRAWMWERTGSLRCGVQWQVSLWKNVKKKHVNCCVCLNFVFTLLFCNKSHHFRFVCLWGHTVSS